ncbi:hypothetical protein BGZ73_008529 [Actinomortierella ambigua]|nr:hypothetical protein BGZ73_008529 [Actinomortierella ambigua]
MQLKSLLISAVAVAAVSAQSFELNECSKCVFASFDKNAVCAKLPAADRASLTGVFTSGSVDTPLMLKLLQNPDIKACMCDWYSTAFTPTGAASGCTSGTPLACNATQVEEATTKLKPLGIVLSCGTAPTNKPPTPSATTGTNGGAGAGAKPTPTGAAVSNLNLPYALSMVAVGAAAFLGL